MKRIYLFFLLLINFVLLKSQEIKLYKYQINNANKDSFGYVFYENDAPLGIKSLTLDNNDNIYFLDAFHLNIKRLDMHTGLLSTININNLKHEKTNLTDIYIWDKNLFIMTEFGAYCFDNEYKTISNFVLPDTFLSLGVIFEKNKNDSLYFYIYDSRIDKDNIEVKYIVFYQKNFSILNQKINFENYYKERKNTISGVKFEIDDEKNVLCTTHGCIALKNKINFLASYANRNITLTSNSLVWFDVTQKEVLVYIYQFPR
jgi:hypothetical protein